jgi:hypothetical protein
MHMWVCGFGLCITPQLRRVVLFDVGGELNGVMGRITTDMRAKSVMCLAWERTIGKAWGNWNKFGEIRARDREVQLYKAFFPPEYIRDIADDPPVAMVNPDHLTEYESLHESVRWIVPFLLMDNLPRMVNVEY